MRLAVAALALVATSAAADKHFAWPDGKLAAISLSWDDARSSQTELGIPLLDKYAVKATFYVIPSNVEGHLKDWQRAVRTGHEIGNHTLVHPCTGNLDFSADNALEDYTLDKMAGEITGASKRIRELLGVTPETFAYPFSAARGRFQLRQLAKFLKLKPSPG